MHPLVHLLSRDDPVADLSYISNLFRFRTLLLLMFTMPLCCPWNVLAADVRPDITGSWILNQELSDDTDRQVEKAIKAGGGKIKRSGKRGKGRHRGGPADQELYDHISYDEALHIHSRSPEYRLVYDDDFQRVFYSDGRGRVASASGSATGERQDFSFAYWEDHILVVESRPRDGGTISENYSLDAGTGQLRVELLLQPLSFLEPINIVRIYDRQALNQ